MDLVFSTAGHHPRNKFKFWREMLVDRFGAVDQKRVDDQPFEGAIEIARIGSLAITRVTQGSVRHERQSLKSRRASDTLMVALKLSGVSKSVQGDRSAIQRAGDLVVLNDRPTLLETSGAGQSLMLELPRMRLESVLGPSSLYTSLTVGADLASTALTLTFFKDLLRVHRDLSPDAAERMAAIGVDLIVASVAERVAQEVPRPLHGSVVVQRAKAHVEANLHDTHLAPPQLAAAMGVSLRRLQELFQERGQPISDWIWERRLAAAAKRLADPAALHLPIGHLAYDCGFTSQAHFSRRFKDCHGLSPREYRALAAVRHADAAPDP